MFLIKILGILRDYVFWSKITLGYMRLTPLFSGVSTINCREIQLCTKLNKVHLQQLQKLTANTATPLFSCHVRREICIGPTSVLYLLFAYVNL